MSDSGLQFFYRSPAPTFLVQPHSWQIILYNQAALRRFPSLGLQQQSLCNLFHLGFCNPDDGLTDFHPLQFIDGETIKVFEKDNLSCFDLHPALIDYNNKKIWMLSLMQELSLQQDDLLSMLNVQKEIIFRYTPDTRLIFVNDAYCSYFKTSRQQMLGRPFLSIVQETEHQRILEHIDYLIKNPRPFNYEYKETFADGHYIWWEWHDYPIVNDKGVVVEIQTVGRDITSRKQVEEKLAVSEATNLKILNTLPDLVFRIDAEGTYLDAYTDNESVFYVPKSVFIGKKITDIIPGEAALKAMKALHKAITTQQKVTYEYKLTVNGKDNFFENRILPISGNEVLSVIRDITASRLSDEAIRNNERFLRKLLHIIDGALNLTDRADLLEYLAQQTKEMFRADNCFVTAWDEVQSLTIPMTADDPSIGYQHLTGEKNELTLTASLMEEGQAITVEDVFNSPFLSPEIAKSFSSRSLLGIPVIGKEKKYGALIIGFNETHEFSITEIERANLTSGILSLIVGKNQFVNDLNESEKMLRSIIEWAPVGIMAVDRLGNYVMTNETSVKLFGYEPGEMEGMNLIDIVHPASAQAGKEHFGKLHANLSAVAELQLVRKDNSLFWASVHGVKIHDNLFIAFMFDITAGIESKAALAHEKALLSGLLKSIPDIVYYKDIDGVYLGCNVELEKMLGLQASDIIGKRDFDLLPPDLAGNCLRQDAIVLTTGENHLFEEWVTYADGRIIPLETLKAPFYDLGGKLIGILALSRDISLRKQQEHLIRQGDKLLHDLSINLPGVLFQLQMDQNEQFSFPYISEKLEEYFHVSIEQLRANPSLISQLIHPDDQDLIRKSIRESFRKIDAWDIEFRIVLDKKGLRWMRLQSMPQKIGRKKVLWHGFITDITEKKQITEALNKSEERLQNILSSLDEVIWSVEMPGYSFSFISPSCQQMFGYSSVALIESPQLQLDLIHPDDLPIFKAGYETLLNQGKGAIEYRIITADGKTKWVLDKALAIKDNNGEIVRLEGIMSDISHRKNSEIKLQQSEERFNLALTYTESGLWDWNVPTGNVFYTDTWKSMLGYGNDDIPPHIESWKKLWHPDDAAIITKATEDYLNQRTAIFEVEYRLRCKSGEWKWILSKGKIIRDESGEPLRWIGISNDISRRKALEEELVFKSSLQKILMDMASNFINLPVDQLDDAISLTLEKVGAFINTDRSYLFDYDLDRLIVRNTHEWCNVGIEPQIENLQESSIDEIPQWIQAHLNNEVMIVEDVQLLPIGSQLREILEPQEIQSMIAVPLFTDAKLTGFLGFDSVKTKKTWSEAEIILLRFMAEIFVNAQKRIYFEKALMESEYNLNLSSEASGTGIWTVDIKSDTISFNKVFEHISGLSFSKKTHPIDDILQFIHPDDVQPFMAEVEKSVSGLIRTFTVEFRAIKPDNSIWWAMARGSVTEIDYEGIPTKFSGTLTDISARKRIEMALKESEERFKSIYNNSVVGLYRTSLNGDILMSNLALARLHGYNDLEEFLKVNIIQSKLVQPEIRKAFINQLLIENQIIDAEYIWINREGNQFYVRENARLVRNENGEIAYIEGSVVDITRQKETELELRESEEKFRQLAENVDDIFWLRDAETLETLYVNPAFERITKIRLSEISNNYDRLLNTIHPDDLKAVIEAYQEHLVNQTMLDIEFRLLVDGQEKWIRAKSQGLTDAGGKLVRLIGLASDITRLKEAEQSLRETLEAEKQLGMLKSRFVSMASHEFRTPLATIQATTETLLAYQKTLTEEQVEKRLNKIIDQINHLKNIMNDVLNLSKIQEGITGFDATDGDLVEFVNEIVDEFRMHPEVRHCILIENTLEQLPFRFDQKLMRQIISNLLSNAFKYSAPSSKVYIRLKKSAQEITLEIQDQGIGIPEPDLQHLFTPFFRANNATNLQGTGLGLPITHQAVALHHGKIEVISVINKGTTMICRFPFT